MTTEPSQTEALQGCLNPVNGSASRLVRDVEVGHNPLVTRTTFVRFALAAVPHRPPTHTWSTNLLHVDVSILCTPATIRAITELLSGGQTCRALHSRHFEGSSTI